ncbi:hypothetical protein C8Q79DRAFT_216153 [Trametes meyenii]|nr:hypothetical protein C8Q79DRAFT_216153 [Trametes meyenii]
MLIFLDVMALCVVSAAVDYSHLRLRKLDGGQRTSIISPVNVTAIADQAVLLVCTGGFVSLTASVRYRPINLPRGGRHLDSRFLAACHPCDSIYIYICIAAIEIVRPARTSPDIEPRNQL